jgi:hypothetical protein
VHTSLSIYARDQLESQLPPGLRARVEEYVLVEAGDDQENAGARFAPDVHVVERPGASRKPGDSTSSLAVADPVIVPRNREAETLHYIQIVDKAAGHRIVTSIEFLSPSNKGNEAGSTQYANKQEKMLAGRVNLVEIDLLRAGAWVLAVPRGDVPKACRQPYRICVVRRNRQEVAEVYRVPLQEPLPTIRIQLREEDADVSLQLQPLIETAYIKGRYYEDIDYRQDPLPPLTGPDAEWSDQLLREKVFR